MPQTTTPVVLLPRFTAIVGAGPLYSTLPIDVSPFERISLSLWRGPVVGSSTPTVAFQVEESTDRYVWSDVGPLLTPSEDIELQVDLPISKRWLRLSTQLTGTNAGVTCWAQGWFLDRMP